MIEIAHVFYPKPYVYQTMKLNSKVINSHTLDLGLHHI